MLSMEINDEDLNMPTAIDIMSAGFCFYMCSTMLVLSGGMYADTHDSVSAILFVVAVIVTIGCVIFWLPYLF